MRHAASAVMAAATGTTPPTATTATPVGLTPCHSSLAYATTPSPQPFPLTAPALQLLEGQAEVFGSALELGERVGLSGQKVAVYTWQGASLEVTGQPDVM